MFVSLPFVSLIFVVCCTSPAASSIAFCTVLKMFFLSFACIHHCLPELNSCTVSLLTPSRPFFLLLLVGSQEPKDTFDGSAQDKSQCGVDINEDLVGWKVGLECMWKVK